MELHDEGEEIEVETKIVDRNDVEGENEIEEGEIFEDQDEMGADDETILNFVKLLDQYLISTTQTVDAETISKVTEFSLSLTMDQFLTISSTLIAFVFMVYFLFFYFYFSFLNKIIQIINF